MSGHTRGPWELVEKKYPDIISSWHIQIGEHQVPFFPFKRVYSEDRKHSGFVIDHTHMADARLIAAAPDMLEALKAAVKEVAGTFPFEFLQAASAAIAKATGEQS